MRIGKHDKRGCWPLFLSFFPFSFTWSRCALENMTNEVAGLLGAPSARAALYAPFSVCFWIGIPCKRICSEVALQERDVSLGAQHVLRGATCLKERFLKERYLKERNLKERNMS